MTTQATKENLVLSGQTDIEKEYVSRTPISKNIDDAGCKYLPGGSTREATDFLPYPIYMEKGDGYHLYSVDGHEYLDFMSNFTVLIHGHAHPAITKAIVAQATQSTILSAPTASQSKLAEIICKRIKSMEMLRFCNSGTEATMYCLRTARALTGKNKFVKMENGFHGNTEQVEISVATPLEKAGPPQRPNRVPETLGITPGVLNDVLIAPMNNIEATKDILNESKDDISAVIVEPIQGAGGMISAQKEYLEFLREYTRHNGMFLIFDEVITYRLTTGGAQEYFGVYPDLTALGKIIGGGLSIGAFGGSKDIMKIFSPKGGGSPMHHSGTFNGNAITMAAGIASMENLTPENIKHINGLGDKLREGIKKLLKEKMINFQITGVGSLMNLHINTKTITDYRSSRQDWEVGQYIRNLLHLALKNQGIYTPSRCMFCISTPMTEEIIQKALEGVGNALEQLLPILKKEFPQFLL